MPVSLDLIRALVGALHFDRPNIQALNALDDEGWRTLLDFTDRTHVTLALASRHYDVLPAQVRERLDRNIAGNAARLKSNQAAYLDIAGALERNGIETLILKGLSHDTPLRPQGDIDLFCPPDTAPRAQAIAMELGYEPITELNEFFADHLPLLIRKTGWRWRGDFFDPEGPASLEIHFRFWDPATERISVADTEEFWKRRQWMTSGDVKFQALDPVDRLSYATLHALRHLLRGDMLLWHVYELAWMLEQRHGDDSFWSTWQARYSDSFRDLQSVVFRLAHNWFGCRLHEHRELPEPLERWFETYGREPIGQRMFPNKSEVWLHTSLVASRKDALHVVRRKLLPLQKRRMIVHPHVKNSEAGANVKRDRAAQYARFLASRVTHHARTLPVALMQGLAWWLRSRGLSPAFLRFLGASSLYNIGMTAFFLLYNLYLLKRGFKEDFIGSVASAMTTGSIAGTLPAGFITSRFGLKPPLLTAFAIAPLICVARTLLDDPTALIVSAFVGGFAMSMYAVALTPTVAHLTAEKTRPLAFSLVTAIGIGIGIFGAAAGGKLPRWVGGLKAALLAACAIAALGGLAISRLRLATPPASPRAMYPRDPAVTRFLAALGLWSLATGALNPFFNVYFASHLKATDDQIGLIFSGSHIMQVAAILAAPLVLRRLGMPLGIMAMQIMTGIALAALSAGPPLAGAAVLYMSYMAFQYMSEPGLFSFLMNHATPQERGGAAALYMMILFIGQAVAAKISGNAIRRFGYPPVTASAAALAMVAALCFRLAMSRRGTRALLERSAAR